MNGMLQLLDHCCNLIIHRYVDHLIMEILLLLHTMQIIWGFFLGQFSHSGCSVVYQFFRGPDINAGLFPSS